MATSYCPNCNESFSSVRKFKAHIKICKATPDTGETQTTPEEEVTPTMEDAPTEDTGTEEVEEQETEATEAPEPAAPAEPVYCLCGCGTCLNPEGKKTKARFAMGHDMKLKSAIMTNIKEAKVSLFEGLSDEAIAYAREKWNDFIGKGIIRHTTKFAKKFEKVEHFNQLHYFAVLDDTNS